MSDPIEHASPHDALFRRAFGEARNAAGLLRAILPPGALIESVDWSTLRLCEGSHVDAALRKHESDLVFSATAADREVRFYVLVEHQSSSDAHMVWRLWVYVTRVYEKWRREHRGAVRMPRVIPVVVYHGERAWSAPRCISELIEDEPPLGPELDWMVPRFRYVLDDLTVAAPESLRARGLPAFAALVLWALQSAPRRTFASTVGIFRDLFDDVLASTDGPEALGTLLRYLSIVTRDDDDSIVHDVLAHLSEPVREEAMSYYDKLIQLGEAKGKAEGRAEGALEGRRALVLKLLALKFGRLDTDAHERIARASLDELDAIAERVLTATTLPDALGL